MQSITSNQTNTLNTISQVRDREIITSDKSYIADIKEHLLNDTISKDIVIRKIKLLEKLYPQVTSDKLLKNNLKQLKKLLEQRFHQKTHVGISINQASIEESEIKDKELFKQIDPMVKKIYIQTDEALKQINAHMQGNKIDMDFLCEQIFNLTSINRDIENIIFLYNDISAGDLLLRLHSSIEKINNTQETLNILLKKETINIQLQTLKKSLQNKENKAEELGRLITTEENYDIFDQFPSVYRQVIEQYLLHIDADPVNFNYNLELNKLRIKNNENKEKLSNKLAEKEFNEKLAILKEKIIYLAEKLESLNSIKSS